MTEYLQNKNSKACHFQAGFTLIEMCFVILISGLFSLTFLNYYKDYSEKQRLAATNEAITVAQGAVREYLSEEGRYPCPANPNLPVTHAMYGQPICSGSGITVVDGRDADANGAPDQVLIGALPVKFLIQHYANFNLEMDVPITEAAVLDGWGQKLTYAVTRSLADPSFVFNERNGAIKVVDEHDEDITPQPGTAHFVIVSHGPNGLGGFSSAGRRTENCNPLTLPATLPPTTVVTPVNERDNCDYSDNKFVVGLRNNTEYSKFDDIVKFYAFQQTDLWRVAASTDYRAYNTNAGNVGISQDVTRTPIQRLDVDGKIAADKIMAAKVCDNGGADCLIIDRITGDVPQMDCNTSDRAFGSISNNQANCVNYKATLPANTGCLPGQIVQGVNGNGTLICVPRP